MIEDIDIAISLFDSYKRNLVLRVPVGAQNRPYFKNSGPYWNKLGSFVDKHHILQVAGSFNFWIKWGNGWGVPVIFFCICC